ncbi:MAG TPA: hypothetical protein VG942_11975 [Hyphomonadaceae bacterium]|nr:hypothetical protein [Hyphomonadaceae bacterium]
MRALAAFAIIALMLGQAQAQIPFLTDPNAKPPEKTTTTVPPASGPAEKPSVTKPKVAKPTPPKSPVAAAPPMQDPGKVFAELVGFCWRAAMADGNSDTHCFSVAFNGKLVMDVHRVRNASQAVVYEGVTVYRPDKATRSLSYDYSNSFGDVLPGQAWREGAVLNFSSQAGKTAKVETSWRINGDAYDTVAADAKTAGLHFKKIGPAGEGGL